MPHYDMKFLDYCFSIFRTLESFHYPDLIMEFDEDDVARSLASIIRISHSLNISPKLCAVCIWSLTMNEQVIPLARESTKH